MSLGLAMPNTSTQPYIYMVYVIYVSRDFMSLLTTTLFAFMHLSLYCTLRASHLIILEQLKSVSHVQL